MVVNAIFVGGPLHGQRRALDSYKNVEAQELPDLRETWRRSPTKEPVEIKLRTVLYRPQIYLPGAAIYSCLGSDEETLGRLLGDFCRFGKIQKAVNRKPWLRHALEELEADL